MDLDTHIEGTKSLYCDLRVPGARQVCDFFNGPRPDLAFVFPSRFVVGELTVCHETNLRHSRDYKLNKYSNLETARSSAFKPIQSRSVPWKFPLLGLLRQNPTSSK